MKRSSKENKAAVVTDCRSMFDILTRTAVPSCTEHRTTIECLLIRECLKSNCDVRWVTSQAMLADCLTKTMDSSALRECLRTGWYSLFDEGLVLKQRADGRQRLKCIKEQQDNPTATSQAASPEAVHAAENFEIQDFWISGPGDQVRRIHVQPRTRSFVTIGVTGCPCDIRELSACRETRVKGVKTEKDFWPGTRGAAPMSQLWTGETIFFRKVKR